MSLPSSPEIISVFEVETASIISSFQEDGIPLETIAIEPSTTKLDQDLNLSRQSLSQVSIDGFEASQSEAESIQQTRNVFQLPPVDTGRAAWGFVLGATLVEGLTWGE